MAQNPSTPIKATAPVAKHPEVIRSFQKDDFPVIQGACLTLAMCLILAISLVLGVRWILVQQQNQQLQAEIALTQVQEKLLRMSSEKHDIDQFQPSYLAAVKHGFVGEEKRLDFVEHVKKIQEQRQLLPLNYEIFPRQNIQLDPSFDMGELELRASRIAIHLPQLHEGDMLNLLADLSQIGIFIPKNCSMTVKPNVEPAMFMARLDGECELYWLSVGRREVVDAAQANAPAQ